MERLLITGVDTLIGSNLALALADRWQVLGLYEGVAVETAAVQTAPWHSDDPDSLAELLERWDPHWVIHCGPLAASSWDREPCPRQAAREPAVAAQLARLTARHASALTVLTSDAVLTGPRMFQDEQAPAGTGARAAQCRALESALETSQALVVRTCAYGLACEALAPGFAAQARDALRCGRMPPVSGRRYATPILATDLAELLLRAYEVRLQGLYHIAGAERTSMYRFVQELAGVLGIHIPDQASRDGAELHEETSLSSRRARRSLAMSTPMLRGGLERLAVQIEQGWPHAWHGSPAPELLQEAA